MYIALSFSFAFWFLGIGSFAYHAYNNKYTVFLDYAGANLVLTNMAFSSLLQFANVQLNIYIVTVLRILSIVGATVMGIVVSCFKVCVFIVHVTCCCCHSLPIKVK